MYCVVYYLYLVITSLYSSRSKDQCSSPSRKEAKRAQYRQVKAHMQKEDGRVTAHGWSLPSKYKVVNEGLNRNKVSGHVDLPHSFEENIHLNCPPDGAQPH